MSAHPIPDSALVSHSAIVGKTGAGKSYAARSTVERILHRGDRACIVDPTGVWWGLRLAANGSAKGGFPVVIAGGRHGDVPLSDGDGAALAKIVGTTSTPLILDTSSMTVGARTKMFTAFAEALLVENGGPLTLVLDEAHLFAPQTRVPDPQSAMMVHAANSLVALGRARGLRIMLLSQRPAKLHKDSLTQVETLVAMRLIAPQDRKAVEEWIAGQADKKQGAEIVASLPSLKQGEGWIWSPDAGVLERATFPTIATFDSMRPEAQGAHELRPVDIAGIRTALAAPDTKTEAAAKPSRKAPATDDKSIDVAAIEQRGYDRAVAEMASWLRVPLQSLTKAVGKLAKDVETDIRIINGFWSHPEARSAKRASAPAEQPTAPDTSPVRPVKRDVAPAPKTDASGDLNITPARQKIIDMLAWFKALGVEPVIKTRVCVMVGLSPKASTFGVYVAELARDGLVETAPGFLRLTEQGARRAQPPDIGSDSDAILRSACAQMRPQPRRLLEIVAQAYPDAVRRDALGDSLGLSQTASTLGVYLSDLSSRGFIENAGRGQVRAADFLFNATKA